MFSSRHCLALLGAVLASGPFLSRGDESSATCPDLPVTRIVLFDTGVGYFEHRSQVTDDTRVDLEFKLHDINDLLKSLVVQDEAGGRVAAITYPAKDPLEQQLGSYSIDLSSLPTLAELLQQLRGEKVRVDAAESVTGTIVGLEARSETDEAGLLVEPEYLNLLTDQGLQSISLRSVLRVQLLDERLNGELEQALRLVADGRRADNRTVSLRFAGQGTRTVRVGYIRETPVWKTSYRLILADPGQPALLQGWAIVENTGEIDWKDVRLTLVSGRPVSFRMELYEPLFVRRPQMEPLVHGSPKPRLHAPASPPLDPDAMGGFFGGGMPGMGGMGMGGMGGGAFGGMGGLEAEDLDEDDVAVSTWDPAQGVLSQAVGGEIGELFQYAIDAPVDLARHQSALLPIIEAPIEAERLSLFSSGVQTRNPLRALRLTNRTELHLTSGPITIFDDKAYAGDAPIQHVRPGEARLISYAVDLETEVRTEETVRPPTISAARIETGRLLLDRTERKSMSYLVTNRAGSERRVIIEHPRPAEPWKIVEPIEPAESTDATLRYELNVAAGATGRLDVVSQRDSTETNALASLLEPTLQAHLQDEAIPADVKQALRELLEMRMDLARLEKQLTVSNQRISEIERQQTRIRGNMENIDRDEPLYQRYLKSMEQQEDELDTIQREMARIREQLREVESRLEALAPWETGAKQPIPRERSK